MLTILCSKTQAAVEYCWRFKDANPDFHIFWIHAGSTVSFDVDYRKLARRLGLMGHTFNVDNDDMRSDVRDWLNENEKWLMVIDNADRYDDFFATEENEVEDSIQTALPWTRPCTAMIVYTSRHGRVGARLTDHPCVQLDVMSASDGLAMFRATSVSAPDDCEVLELLEALEFLPLSIAHAVAYLNFTKIPVAAYVRYVEVSDEKLLDMLGQNMDVRRRDPKAPRSIAKTWLVSFELICRLGDRTTNLFCLAACLERQSISSTFIVLFCDWTSQGSNSRSAQTLLELELPTTHAEISVAIAEFQSLALISYAYESNQLSMHRHIQAATLRHLSETGRLLAFIEQLAQFILTLREPKSGFAPKFTDSQLSPVAANLFFLLSEYHRHTCSNSDPGCELLEDLLLASLSLQLNSMR
jgi:hypothetical protein